ncbi:hypothetical protein SBRCBS47491_002270 [Sporothrix bragantina]|uniref:BZIP domain-containing protein n=1 Tax=Sporothrix bragantina TaxID=671064 RepID=A0ABP0B6E9_9PEZI
MASFMDSSPSTASMPDTGSACNTRPDAQPGLSSNASKLSRGAVGSRKPAKVSKTKTPDGLNSDHRKEQNRIASRNYPAGEKRKHKLALLKQILDEPSAGEAASKASATPSTSTPVPETSTLANDDGPSNALLDNLSGSLVDILPDFQPIMTGLLTSNMVTPASSASITTATAPSLSTTTPGQQPLDDSFAAWAASNLPSAVAANSLGKTSTPATYNSTLAEPPSSSTAVSDNLLDMPMLQPWLIPFSDDSSPFSSYFPPTTQPIPSFTPAQASSLNPSAASTAKAKVHTPSGLSVTDSIDIDDAFDPAIDVDQMMSGSDSNTTHRNNVADSNSIIPNFSTSYYANSFQNIQIQGGGGLSLGPTSAASPMPTGASASSFNNSRQHQTRFMTTTLPSRPSPRPFFQTLASPPDATNITNNMEQEPSRQTRKKNKPVVRAMVQYVQNLSPHQKRLILQALLDDDGRGGDAGDEDDLLFGNDDDDRIEEIDGTGNDSEKNRNSEIDRKHEKWKNALIARREDRRRQVVARWNSHRWASEAAENGIGVQHVSSSASSTYSPSSSLGDASEAATFANFAVSGLDGMGGISGLGGPIPKGNSLGGALPYFSASLNIMTLQCRRMGFRAALLQNCLACGLPNPDVMFDEDCYEESDDMLSPFALKAEEARAVVLQGVGQIAVAVATVRQNLARSGKMPPRDLQPVDAQILVAHHPYLDVIPFRGFRARALALLAEMEAAEEVAAAVSDNLKRDGDGNGNGASTETPCLLDEDELCYDMNVADGLVCWGSQMGNAGASLSAQAKRDSDSARDMRSCLPWDMRSWEPQVWFLKKYWFLVGGWDDDMWRNCRWWHSMRGDDLDYSVFASPGY